MYGKYPRSVLLVFHNPEKGREDEFNYWYNDIHIPDVLSIGVFDRVYRYKAAGEAKTGYLAVWESDYADLPSALPMVRKATEGLRARGRMWPVSQVVWAQPFFAVGPAQPVNAKPVTFLSTNQTSCSPPGREEEFNRWYNELHLPEFLAADYCHSAYRYQRYDQPAQGEGQFLALYEGDLDEAQRDAALKRIRDEYMARWYETVGENRLKVRQQQGDRPRPHNLVLELQPAWAGTWRPI